MKLLAPSVIEAGWLRHARDENHRLVMGESSRHRPYTVKLLKSLGYRVSLKQRASPAYWYATGDSRNKAQIGVGEWISDYPQAPGFKRGGFHRGSRGRGDGWR